MTVGLLRLPPLPLYTLFSHFIIHKFQLYKVTFRNVRFSFPFLSFLFSMYNTINIRNETFHLLIVSTILFVHSFRAIYFNYYSFRTENGNLDFSLIKFTKDPVSKNFDHGDEEFFFFSLLAFPSRRFHVFASSFAWNLSLCNLRSRAWERFDPLLPMNRTAKFSSTRTSFQDCLRCHDTVQNQDPRWAILPTSYPSFSSAFSFFPFIRASRAIIAPSLRLIKFCLFLFDLLSPFFPFFSFFLFTWYT